jgi:hypothetical protein
LPAAQIDEETVNHPTEDEVYSFIGNYRLCGIDCGVRLRKRRDENTDKRKSPG